MSHSLSFSLRMPVLAFMLAMAWQGAQAQQVEQDRIESLRLSSGGVAEVHRRIWAEDASGVRLVVPVAQLDDLLKSLVVRDPNGKVTSIVMDGLSPLHETLEDLPFSLEDMQSPASLAARLQGARVRAASGGRTVEGAILGVAQAAGASANESKAAPLLSVLAADGRVQTLRLGNDSVLDVLDEDVRAQLQAALDVSRQHRNESIRSVTISLDGKGKRYIDLSYVIAAPVWKSAYRLVMETPDKARLQAWAVLENASGKDWKNVAVTLTSGAPVMLSQRLLQRYWNERPELPVAVGAAQAPRADTHAETQAREHAVAQMQMAKSRKEGRMAAMPAPAFAEVASAYGGAAADSPVLAQAATQEGRTSVSYALPVPVSVAAGQTLSVPFVDASLKAEQVSVFQADRKSVYPVAGVWLENSTKGSLPPGILTVYDQTSGHIGDAQLTGLPAGESRLVYFAEDRKVEVRADTKPQERVSEVKISQGVLHITRQLLQETTYTIKGAADAPRTVLIEQARRQGWELKSEALAGTTAKHYRLKARVPAAGTAQVKALSQRSEQQAMQLLDADADRLLYWAGAASDARTAQRLTALADLRRQLAQAQQREAALTNDKESIAANQARIRENLSSVPAESTLGQRYLQLLAQEEDKIAAVEQEVEKARKQTMERRKALEAALAV
ncbi:MAG: DUF4139 domain-containing protein [Burkholderiaceae bacterium]